MVAICQNSVEELGLASEEGLTVHVTLNHWKGKQTLGKPELTESFHSMSNWHNCKIYQHQHVKGCAFFQLTFITSLLNTIVHELKLLKLRQNILLNINIEFVEPKLRTKHFFSGKKGALKLHSFKISETGNWYVKFRVIHL